MGRAPCCDKGNVKRGPWSPEEDSKLKEYIEKHGTGGNWIALPQKAGLRRCGKSCRLRWLNYLRPNIKHGEFSDEEDRIICTLYSNIGSRWSIIAAQLPGRTDNDIKNYWNTKLKKKLMGFLPPSYSSHHTTKLLPYQSSPPQNPTFPSPHYYNSAAANISFSSLEPISVPSTSCYTTTSSISHQLPFYQNQESMVLGAISPSMQYYYPMSTESLVMFGSEGSCNSSSDGSCSSLGKQEEMMMGFQNFMMYSNNNNNNKFMFGQTHQSCSINDDGGHENVNQLLWEAAEEKPKGCFSQTQTPLDYDLEVIKQLISSSNNSSSSCNNGYLSVDENKTKEEKTMYYYY